MSRAAELFSDEAMGYTAPVAKGAALGYPEQVGGVTDLLGARQEMGQASLEEQRYLQMGGANTTWAPKVNKKTESRTQNPNTGMMLAAQGDLFEDYGVVKSVTNVGPIQKQEFPRTVPQTPQKGLGPGLGNVGMLPGEEKKVPDAPSKMRQPQFGGNRKNRKTRKHKKTKKSRTSQKQKSLINLRITGQIRLKQRHRQ